MVVKAHPNASLEDGVSRGRRDLLGAFIADMDLAVPTAEDCVRQVRTIGLRRDLEERWAFLISGVGGFIQDSE